MTARILVVAKEAVIRRFWEIRTPKGTKAIITNAEETKVILNAGSNLKIRKIVKDSTLDIDGSEVKMAERIYAEVIQ